MRSGYGVKKPTPGCPRQRAALAAAAKARKLKHRAQQHAILGAARRAEDGKCWAFLSEHRAIGRLGQVCERWIYTCVCEIFME